MNGYLPTFKSQGQGPLVLFLHGLGGNRHAFDHQLAQLSDRFHCVAWDLPGYGGSPALQHMSFAVLIEAVTRLLEHFGEPPYAVVGHSLGGNIAQSWVLAGGQCDRLVLAQTTGRFGKPGSDWNREFLAARLQPIEAGKTPADFARALITQMFHDPDNSQAIEEAVATMAPLPAPVYRQVIECLVTFDEFDRLDQISVPTLCLAAEGDRTAPPKAVAQLAERIPQARLQILPDTGHLAYVETPQDFTRAIEEFLLDG